MLPKRLPRPWLLCLLAASCLTGCAAANSEPTVNGCTLLALRSYPPAEQRRVADEIEAAPAAAVWPGWIEDYATLRAAIKACKGAM